MAAEMDLDIPFEAKGMDALRMDVCSPSSAIFTMESSYSADRGV